jgi:hypothetical protein
VTRKLSVFLGFVRRFNDNGGLRGGGAFTLDHQTENDATLSESAVTIESTVQ